MVRVGKIPVVTIAPAVARIDDDVLAIFGNEAISEPPHVAGGKPELVVNLLRDCDLAA